MSQKKNIEKLWCELILMENINDRRALIHNDVKIKNPKYQILAKDDPYRFFELLGGDESEINSNNWAFKYTYEDYIEENDIEYDHKEADGWNLEEKSIEHANDTGHWYVTGTCMIESPNNIKLEFEFDYCDGLLDKIIGTPYNVKEHGNHGILF
ncbi:hypothetical protein [Flavobacterium sp.]|uniref:hypothetical protein n=1 Tax=Flavobacterium sp. TaxID=239 RepID=UPI0035B30242